MNANELADELKYFHETLCDTGAINAVISGLKVKQIETMLRQQQAEIEALKKQLAFMEGEYPEPTIMAKMMEVDLVRQQQAEIEALKAELRLIDELVTGKAQEK